ncbi:MAG: hypothetical protein CL678_05400 [Bdellovibrionaceae bacterium]|nr:hypothetical protein [Pseudobdellovibrionaceae bacterium]|tara:strand:- start:4042 stop:5019 length:978 start_codon:yes stop_codon:yes gene_type:complete
MRILFPTLLILSSLSGFAYQSSFIKEKREWSYKLNLFVKSFPFHSFFFKTFFQHFNDSLENGPIEVCSLNRVQFKKRKKERHLKKSRKHYCKLAEERSIQASEDVIQRMREVQFDFNQLLKGNRFTTALFTHQLHQMSNKIKEFDEVFEKRIKRSEKNLDLCSSLLTVRSRVRCYSRFGKKIEKFNVQNWIDKIFIETFHQNNLVRFLYFPLCGYHGTLRNRMIDCKKQNGESAEWQAEDGSSWSLISSSGLGDTVWIELDSYVLWFFGKKDLSCETADDFFGFQSDSVHFSTPSEQRLKTHFILPLLKTPQEIIASQVCYSEIQ